MLKTELYGTTLQPPTRHLFCNSAPISEISTGCPKILNNKQFRQTIQCVILKYVSAR